MKTLLLILLFALGASAQCRNLPTMEFFDHLRQYPPATITDFSGDKISFTISTKESVFISEMKIDDKTRLPIGFEKNYKSGTWIIYYCDGLEKTTALLIVKNEPSKERYESKAELDKRNAAKRKQ